MYYYMVECKINIILFCVSILNVLSNWLNNQLNNTLGLFSQSDSTLRMKTVWCSFSDPLNNLLHTCNCNLYNHNYFS